MIPVLAVSEGSVFKMSGVCFKITRLMTYKCLFSTFKLNIPDKILANATFTSPVCFCYMIKQLWDQIKSWFFLGTLTNPSKWCLFPISFWDLLMYFIFRWKYCLHLLWIQGLQSLSSLDQWQSNLKVILLQ